MALREAVNVTHENYINFQDYLSAIRLYFKPNNVGMIVVNMILFTTIIIMWIILVPRNSIMLYMYRIICFTSISTNSVLFPNYVHYGDVCASLFNKLNYC